MSAPHFHYTKGWLGSLVRTGDLHQLPLSILQIAESEGINEDQRPFSGQINVNGTPYVVSGATHSGNTVFFTYRHPKTPAVRAFLGRMTGTEGAVGAAVTGWWWDIALDLNAPAEEEGTWQANSQGTKVP